eukprot:maker-scaffold_50-snap-gene-1.3-mRNA-1 protein AED:0.10 eAED:0.10 QI:50/1/1/1/1/1/2/227/390
MNLFVERIIENRKRELNVDVSEIKRDIALFVDIQTRYVLQEAKLFMKKHRRRRMTAEDIIRSVELNGYPISKLVIAKNENSILRSKNRSKEFPVNDLVARKIINVEEYEEKQTSDFQEKVEIYDDTFTFSWSVIDGIQTSSSRLSETFLKENEDNALIKKLRKQISKDEKELKVSKISNEHQIYYRKITSSILTNSSIACAQIRQISRDDTIQVILSYFVKFSKVVIASAAKDVHVAIKQKILLLLSALVFHDNFQIAAQQVRNVVPLMLSLLLAKSTGFLREKCAWLVSRICLRFGATFVDLKARVIKSLVNSLEKGNKREGAVLGLCALGSGIALEYVLPRLRVDKDEEGIMFKVLSTVRMDLPEERQEVFGEKLVQFIPSSEILIFI